MKNAKYTLLIVFLFFIPPVFAWSAVGHRVIARIAYDYLTPNAKRHYAHLNQALNTERHHFNLITAAVWLDLLYSQELMSLRPIHYIDIPFSTDDTPLPQIESNNAVNAIRTASVTLINPQASVREQAVALRILLHVIGDVHQPLHTTTRVSDRYPQGDRGGNDFKLGKNPVAPTLHRYWDRGGGLLQYPMSSVAITRLARDIEIHTVCPPEDFDPMDWVEESHQIAVKQVYALEENTIPSNNYQYNTYNTSKHQLAFAGCRLAAFLNHLYYKKSNNHRVR